MSAKDLLFLLLLGLSTGLIAYCYSLHQRFEKFRQASVEKQEQLKNALLQSRQGAEAGLPGSAKTDARRAGGQPAGDESHFAESLGLAEMQIRLKGGDAAGRVPDKYRLVSALAEHGLNMAAIGEILQLSPGEAEQLVSLCQVSRVVNGKV